MPLSFSLRHHDLLAQRTGIAAHGFAPIKRRVRVNVKGFLLGHLAVGFVRLRPALLLRGTRVPSQRARDALEPFAVGPRDRREWVLRGRNGHLVTVTQLDPPFAVERAVRGRARVAWNGHAEKQAVREDHRSK